MPSEKILIIEDEKAIGDLLIYNLQKEGYTAVRHALTGESGLEEVRKFEPDLIFLDLMLPEMSGLDVCRKLKSRPETSRIPIIMLTAKSEESDMIVGLELGADDYVTKPFGAKLLLARMRAVLRRCSMPPENFGEDLSDGILCHEPLWMNLFTRQMKLAGEPVTLTFNEFNILHLLASRPGRVFTRSQLVLETRGDDYPVTERAIDVQILGLRRKLGEYATLIETIRGVGYRFVEEWEKR
ncbi:MAG: response regulator transcription factor [Planctomycetia bacterium]|nr:response regulator transcription factor [Planctomycetia bacterium]